MMKILLFMCVQVFMLLVNITIGDVIKSYLQEANTGEMATK